MNEMYELYVLGLCEDPERSQIEEALRRGDPEATERLRRALETNAMIAATAPDVEPPKRLRNRVIAIAKPEQPRYTWNLAWIGLSACLVGGLVYTSVDRQRASNELADTRKTLEVREATLEFLRAPETRILNTAAPEEQKPVAKVFVNAGRGVLIVASNLPKLDAGRTYEMWVVPKAGGPRPMGLFKPNADGTATHFQAGVVNLAEAAAIALSNEPDGGSPAPTTPPFLITPVGD